MSQHFCQTSVLLTFLLPASQHFCQTSVLLTFLLPASQHFHQTAALDVYKRQGSEVKPGDIILIRFGNGEVKARVLQLLEHVTKETSPTMYEIIE